MTSQEPLLAYAQRMTGITSLYAAIIAVVESSIQLPDQYRPAALWRLIVSLLQPPLVGLEPTPQLLETIFSIVGPLMQSIYGRQWQKLWRCLKVEGLDSGRAGFNANNVSWCKASVIKLGLLLEDWQKAGIKPISGSSVEE